MSRKVFKLVAACLLLISFTSLAGCLVGYPYAGPGPRHGYRPAPYGYYHGGYHGYWR
jgi:hypothetical protein